LGILEAGDDLAEGFFGLGAAAETPGVADEFGGGNFFDGVGGGEGGPEGGAEVFVVFLFFGLDAVTGGEEAEFLVIAGGFRFSGFGFGAGGGLGVFAIGFVLRFCCHGTCFLFSGFWPERRPELKRTARRPVVGRCLGRGIISLPGWKVAGGVAEPVRCF
jgi:hypothetical protein